MAYVGDTIDCRGACYFTGKETFQWYRGGFFVRDGIDDEKMEVENGKITYWENYHC